MSRSRSSHGSARPQNTIARLIAGAGGDVAEHLLRSFAGAETPRLTVARADKPTAPARYAALHRGSQTERLQLRAMYEQCLTAYRASRTDDTARNVDDAGAALAFFIAANLSVVEDRPVAHPVLDRIERQLVGLAHQLSNWDRASVADRQFYCEQMAMLGAFMIGRAAKAKQEGPVAIADVKRAACNYVQHVLGIDAARVTLDPHGLVLRKTDEAHGAA